MKPDQMMPHQKLDELKRLIKRLSYREGDFTLASGQKSGFYIDLKATTLHAEGAALIGELGLQALSRDDIGGVGGLTLGADPIATAISIFSFQKGKPVPAFIVRKESKGHGTASKAVKLIEGMENLTPNLRLAVVEDVCTTGGSSLQAVQTLREAGLNPRLVLTVVDREQGGREAIRAAGLEFRALCTLSEIKALKI